MTIEDIDNAVRAAGAGWDQRSQRLVLTVKATPNYCNSLQCKSLIAAATRNGKTAADVGAAAFALANGRSIGTELSAAGDHVGARAARDGSNVLMRALLAP